MQKLLITGGAGYIGSHAVYAALEAGYTVAVVDDLSTGTRQVLPDNIAFYEVDIKDRKALNEVFVDYHPVAVMHFAGSIVVPESVENPIKYYTNNTMASLNLIQTCVEHGVDNFVFSSTAAVYGIPREVPVKETAITQPINPYGSSKLMTEQVLSDVSKAEGMTYAALRYFNVAGADPQGRTGQMTPDATHLIKVACQVALGLRPTLKVFGNDYDTPDGTCVRDYIHVTDLAEAHIVVLDYMIKNKQSLTLNCGNGRGYSVKEVIDKVQGISSNAFAVEETERRLGDPPALVADPQRLQTLTGWKARYTDLEEIIASAYHWEKKISSL